MSIRFPKVHIAQSVVNRIINAADELESRKKLRSRSAVDRAPNVPNPSLEGAQLDNALAQPVPPVAGPPALGEAVIAKGLGL